MTEKILLSQENGDLRVFYKAHLFSEKDIETKDLSEVPKKDYEEYLVALRAYTTAFFKLQDIFESNK